MGEPQSGALLCLIPGPSVELAREPDQVRWCFGCRSHLPHEWVCFGDAEPSYYDPVWVKKCSRCGEDRTAFPRSVW